MADPSTAPPLTRASVEAAHKLIEPYIHRTPVLTNATLDRLASTPRTEAELAGTEWAGRTPARPVLRFWFKCENFQRVGAFKARGAFHAIERLKQEPGWVENGGPEKGVVTHSSGNHAQALSLAARESGIAAHIIMPSNSALPKIAATRGYGASVTHSGPTAPEREAAAAAVLAKTGGRMVPPYNHPDIILGQGTAALELQAQFLQRTTANDKRKLRAIITPCGGGGLLSGTALACEGTGVAVFGAEPSFEGADDARRGLETGERIRAVTTTTIADGLRTPVGEIPWSIIHDRKLVRGIYSVSEDDIKRTLRLVYERVKIIVEPSSVVGLAVALFNEDFRSLVEREGGEEGWDLGVVFTGGNVNLDILGSLIA
ncbi:putative serine racemase [Corynascus novoguineensis]|uniref:Serine racemase n=1 Tax=Corynascus novoguineensis TaxID=1126955 RepID=A0AAN7CPX8_9PEZI|nr:putative serine racemase [Corynascus novoguineensis]